MLLEILASVTVVTATTPPADPGRRAAEPQSRPAVSNAHFDLTFDQATAARRSVRVVMTFDVSDTGAVLLSLPVWTPGAYDLSHFAGRVSRFEAWRDTVALDWDKADPDTWRIGSPGPGPVRLLYEVLADTLDTGMAWSRSDFLLLNGTAAFLYPEGADLGRWGASVRIATEPDWLVATGMTPGDTAGTWAEASYHDLVDMPIFVGRFDLDSLQVGSVWMRFATYPAGSVAGEARSLTWDALARMLPPMRAVFGEVPFRTYTVMQIADSSFGGGSGLEHANSHVDIVSPLAIGNPFLNGLYAHEIFHAWNVKRLRPAELVPYRYDAWQPTTLLWVSEGITDYYADLAQLRGGLITPDQFYALTMQKVDQVANTLPVALEDASLSTWVSPRDGTGYVYYPKGSLAGLLLDIIIRDASDNRSSLDDVMRSLYESTFEKGRGFTEDDWWTEVGRAARGRDFSEFRELYIDGREPFPYSSVLPLAGLRLQADTLLQPRIGVSVEPHAEGVRVVEVVPGSMAATAGVLPGDRLLSVGDVEVDDVGFGADFRSLYSSRGDDEIEIVVQRGEEELTLDGRIELAPVVSMRIAPVAGADSKAATVRDGLLAGTVSR